MRNVMVFILILCLLVQLVILPWVYSDGAGMLKIHATLNIAWATGLLFAILKGKIK